MLLCSTDDVSDAQVILSRGDLVLREADVKLLRKSGEWLNDALITFRFQSLAEKLERPDVLLLDASVGYFLSCCDPADIGAVAGPLQLSTRALILCPVSDNSSPEVALGGSHWTLLAFWPGLRRCCFYDSLGGRAGANVQAAATSLASACGLGSTPRLETPSCPKQANGSDCGLHVVLYAEAVCDAHCKHSGPPSSDDLSRIASPAAAAELRRSMLQDIESLAQSTQMADWSD
jgi:sentrin-specific protease 8